MPHTANSDRRSRHDVWVELAKVEMALERVASQDARRTKLVQRQSKLQQAFDSLVGSAA